MTLQWFVTGASLLVALIALNQARRTARRLEQLSQNYWELKYQNGELRVQLLDSVQQTSDATAGLGRNGDMARALP